MKNLAIIPARGGSKRIPRKNIKPFLNKPIIGYSIEAAIQSALFDEVMVSTDDNEIADIARQLNAKVPYLRSARNADDHATLMDVILEVLDWYEGNGIIVENVCCILPTAPFVTAAKLINGYEMLMCGNFSAIFPVVKFSYPIQRALKVDPESHSVTMANPKNLLVRSQDLDDRYHDSGQFYWGKVPALKEEKTLFTAQAGVMELTQLEVEDIDNEIDWILAEEKFKAIKKLNT